MTIATLLFALIATVPTDLGRAGDPIMLDFTATWCGPCRQMRPVVDDLVRQGFPIKAVDVDRSPDLAERYQVTGVPAFIVIDPSDGRELGRTEGARPGSELADLYNQARARFRPRNPAPVRDESEPAADPGEPDPGPARNDDDPAQAKAQTRSPNPKPWETVVRIKVHGNGAIGFGSGTIIHSSPQESLILTCAHIFKLENGPTPPPSRFPRKITIDLFDGNLSGPKKNQVHYTNETFDGEAVDYDFARDVGLIRIRPGRRLPYARVVPPHWKPKPNFAMVTVGCSEGHDATAWSTVVVNPNMKGLNGNHTYEAIECMIAPKQGRSGGGLFTSDGYVAGVCDFAEPQGNHGLYAAPASIYKILDRNNLMALYDPSRQRPGPVSNAPMLAENRPRAGAGLAAGGEPQYRFQSPDRNDPGAVTMPPPEMLGITPPVVADNAGRAQISRRNTSHSDSWVPARTADLKIDPSADTDRFATAGPGPEARPEPSTASVSAEDAPATARPAVKPVRRASSSWRGAREPLPELSAAMGR